MGHKIVSEIFYDNFEFNGSRPFESIDTPKSIQLVEGCLPTAAKQAVDEKGLQMQP